MKKVKLNNVVLGDGSPKIAVPIVATEQAAIIEQAKTVLAAQPDVVEWRIDFLAGVLDSEKLKTAALDLRQTLGETPLLTTFRTAKEGGNLAVDDETYFQIVRLVVENELTTAIDVELFHQKEGVMRIIKLAHDHGIKVIMSSHDFKQTPTDCEIYYRLHKMADLGADVAKIAVMPQNPADVLTLLAATHQAQEKLDLPLITMAMGNLGKVTRIAGEIFGSSLTFGTVGKASAPGQLSITDLKQVLNDLKL
ncbi:type I 3-dehydroquinate dehydratase [Limosilactobacillus mucosae]|uniref:type I 3-dehydroquinate dehydratase n=1 Tax=Limosilactobacillus mucosae TaxID=97478 RepID=UPI0039947DD3